MKILAFSDIHGKKFILDSVIKTAKKKDIDFLVCAGDLSDFGEKFEELLCKFKDAGKPLIIIPGNHEEGGEFNRICKKYKDFVINLHLGSYCIGDYCFLGYGGGGFSRIDKDFEVLVSKFLKANQKYKHLIILTHQPPYKTALDKIDLFDYVGSQSIREAIIKLKPDLAISGHIHETSGKIDRLKNSILINPGPIGKVIEI